MKFLNRDALLKKMNLKKELFELPEDQGCFYIREMTGKEYEDYADTVVTRTKNEKGVEEVKTSLQLLPE